MRTFARRCEEKEHKYHWYKEREGSTSLHFTHCCYEKPQTVWAAHRLSNKTLFDRRLRQYFAAVKREIAEGPARITSLEDRFHALVCRWREETKTVSSTTDRVLHPAYQDIIGMGRPAVPLILREMEKRGGHWFWALRHITETNPVSPEDAGQIPKMTEAWLRWGREQHYL